MRIDLVSNFFYSNDNYYSHHMLIIPAFKQRAYVTFATEHNISDNICSYLITYNVHKL